MFNCSKCEVLNESLAFERQRVKDLTDRLIAMSNPSAFFAVQPQAPIDPKTVHGDIDERIAYDMFGQRVILTHKESDEGTV